jgi:hypothetical protein
VAAAFHGDVLKRSLAGQDISDRFPLRMRMAWVAGSRRVWVMSTSISVVDGIGEVLCRSGNS